MTLPISVKKLKRMTPLERVNKAHGLLYQALYILSPESMVDSVDYAKGHIALAYRDLELYRINSLNGAPKNTNRAAFVREQLENAVRPREAILIPAWESKIDS